MHFYINSPIKTQGLLQKYIHFKINRLQGNILIGICNSLNHQSIDYILNKSGELKKKESIDSKYKLIKKIPNFTISEGDIIYLMYYPLKQQLRIENQTL